MEKVEIDGAEKKVDSFENLGGCENGVNGASRRCTNHNKVSLLFFCFLFFRGFTPLLPFCITMNVLLKFKFRRIKTELFSSRLNSLSSTT